MRKRLVAAGIGVAVITVLAFGGIALSQMSGMDKKAKAEWYKEVELFADTLALIHAGYVDEVKPKDLIYGALNGMLASLDPHSQFLDPDSYNELKSETEGKFGGLGIEITMKDGLLTVITPIEDTPAWNAGIKAGDRIVKIDDELTRDMPLMDAVKKMRGKPGDAVKLTVLRESAKKIIDFSIVRDIIKINDIKEALIIEDGIGYIRLAEFREDTTEQFRAKLDKLLKDGLTSLIIDLRNNPGGLLDVAVKVTENFVEPGKMVVFTKGREHSQNIEFVSRADKPVTNLPMVILINEGSASGSEIMAGCLKDYKRAVIMGTKSFGKGSVQTVIPLSDGSALRLTTSKYYTPLGNIIHNKGVIPDIVVEAEVEADEKEDVEEIDRANEVFEQVVKDKEVTPAAKAAEQAQPAPKKKFTYTDDVQIVRAVDVLKAVKIYGGFKK